MTTSCARALAVVLGLLAVLLPGAPALAHESDPRLVTAVEQISPALPDDVVVQVQAGIATQLVARNPTPVVLEVLGASGRPFLRISSAGVFADVGAEEFFTTSNPDGAAPSGAGDDAARWVQISAGDSWGWYDHRLHPEQLRAPEDEQRAAELADFEVPLRYGEQAVTVSGTVQFQPLLGSLLVSADPAPAGLQVQALPGRLPGLFLRSTGDAPVTVQGRDGEPFLRITGAGVEVNENSRTHVEDRQARGQSVGAPSTTPAFRLVAPGASSYTWLDARLRYAADLPPEQVLRADGPTVVQEWDVPVQVGAEAGALSGDVTWVPEPDAAALVGGATPVADDEDPGLLPWTLLGAAVLALGIGVVVARRSGRAQPTAGAVVPRHTKREGAASEREDGRSAS